MNYCNLILQNNLVRIFETVFVVIRKHKSYLKFIQKLNWFIFIIQQ